MAEYCAFSWGAHFNPLLTPVVETNGKKDKKTLIQNLRLFAQSKSDIGISVTFFFMYKDN